MTINRRLVCRWTPMDDQDGAWNTECGDVFWMADGTPQGHNMRFCPYCGGALIQETTGDHHEL